MNIYIPKHLRQLELVDNMCRMIEEYSMTYYSSTSYPESIDDPVKKFLTLVCKEENIDYLVHLFYSVKGTIQVLYYMKKFLGYDLTYSYSTKLLQLRIENVELLSIDEGTFRILLENFLNALLYFKELDLSVEVVDMHLKEELDNYVGAGLILINKIEI